MSEPPTYPGADDPQYPQGDPVPSYPAAQPPQPPAGSPAGSPTGSPASVSLLDRLGGRAAERPQPRAGVAVAGLGGALVIGGIFLLTYGYLVEHLVEGDRDDSRRWLGVALSLVAVVIGYALVIKLRRGPLATAGVALSAFGVPVLMEFLSFDAGSRQVVNFDAVTWVTVIVSVIAYLAVPGARGRSVYAGLALLLIWEWVVDQVAPTAANTLTGLSARFSVPGVTADLPSPNWGGLAAASLAFGLGYYAIAFGLDRSGRHGLALPFVVVGVPATVVGVAALGPGLGAAGAGIVLFLIGLVLAAYGARFGRRATTWLWAAGSVVGAILVLARAVTGDSITAVGALVAVLGLVVIAVGTGLGVGLREEPDVVEAGDGAPAEAPGPYRRAH